MKLSLDDLRGLLCAGTASDVIASWVGKRVLVRSATSGVWAGTLARRSGPDVLLSNARRLWRWKGATECCQLAQEGISAPSECKFPVVVPAVFVSPIHEVYLLTDKAAASIEAVPVWRV